MKACFASGAVFGSLGGQINFALKGAEGLMSHLRDMDQENIEIQKTFRAEIDKVMKPDPVS